MRKAAFAAVVLLASFVTVVLAQAPAELKGHQGLVFGVAFSPDGKTLATAGFDGFVKLWDFPAGKEHGSLKAYSTDDKKPVYSVVFSPDGNLIATAGADSIIRVWDKSGKQKHELKGHTNVVDALAFSPDNKTLASGAGDKDVRLWDAVAGKEIKKLGSHKESVYAVAFSPNGELLASTGNDGFIKIWEVKGQKEIKQLEVPVEKPMIVETKKEEKKEEKKDDKKDKKEEKKDAKKKEEKKKEEPKEIRDGINAVAFSADNNQVFSAGYDRYLRIWNVADGKETKKLGPTPDYLMGVALSRDGKFVAASGYGGSLHVWEIASGKEIFNYQLKSEQSKKMVTYGITFTPDGKALVTGHEKDNAARVTPLSAK